jgi:hypothetical protein
VYAFFVFNPSERSADPMLFASFEFSFKRYFLPLTGADFFLGAAFGFVGLGGLRRFGMLRRGFFGGFHAGT